VQVDVDHEKAIAKKYSVSAMPTIVVLGGGKEIDRMLGYQGPGDFVEWLGAVKAGKSSAQLVRKLEEEEGISGVELVKRKIDAARGALESGEYERATETYAWLWENMLDYDPAMAGVRGSYMVSEIGQLVRAHPPARERFESFRDEAKKKLDAQTSTQSVADWIDLSTLLGDGEAVIAWYDRVKDSPAEAPTVQRVSFKLRDLFAEHERWEALGRTLTHPTMMLDVMLDAPGRAVGDEAPDPQRARFMAELRERASEMARSYHTGLLAAGRYPEAFHVADTFIKKFGDENEARLLLARHALDAGHPHEEHLEWLEQAGDESLLKRVRRALERR